MKRIIYYQVYAERHPDYGRTVYGNFTNEKIAKKCKDRCIKKYVNKGKDYTQDGYFFYDWKIEERELILNEKNEYNW